MGRPLNPDNYTPQKKITQRHIEIIKFYALGYSAEEIAEKLFISRKTVDTHRYNFCCVLKLRNLADITRYAIKEKIIEV